MACVTAQDRPRISPRTGAGGGDLGGFKKLLRVQTIMVVIVVQTLGAFVTSVVRPLILMDVRTSLGGNATKMGGSVAFHGIIAESDFKSINLEVTPYRIALK